MIPRYVPAEVEPRWQQRWAEAGIYHTDLDAPAGEPWYVLTMFPYPSGNLHIGHWYAMGVTDAQVRFQRMRGRSVFYPIGFDAFGLPAENAAIRNNVHPREWTLANIDRMRRQLRSMGAAFDWDAEIVTCLPEYYRWNQWLFLRFLEKGLAYRKLAAAWWCPNDQTVLANEQVLADGTCERCGAAVYKRDLEQWFLRITDYAEELLRHEGLEWPERVLTLQRNWIGKSTGAEILFDLEGHPDIEVRVFTTRPDTVYGVSFLVFAPEHPAVERITTPERRDEVAAYVAAARRQSEIDRLSTEREKTGTWTGAWAINRLSGERVPVWIADYVLATYGTGIVMGVPAHDERDFAFATRYGLPIPVVVAPPDWDGSPLGEAWTAPGTMVNSGPFSGLPSEEGKEAVARYLEERAWGRPAITYRLRDWLISRQRFWGTPIPVVYCGQCGMQPVPDDQLPVVLPDDVEFRPTGESPLRSSPAFLHTTCPACGGPAEREVDTMDTFVDSSWYQYRYLSPHEDTAPVDLARARRWLPVHQYTGGIEHATMHLLYTRFFTKAMRDCGVFGPDPGPQFDEPMTRLFNQGVILGPDGEKMSKSRGNVVDPDEYVGRVGADAIRVFLMFIGPWDQGGPWNPRGIEGPTRFLNRVWALALADDPAGSGDPAVEQELRRAMHKTIRKVTEDQERFRYNTMIASLMEYVNTLGRVRETPAFGSLAWHEAVDTLLLLLAPAAPHLTEEAWERRGRPFSIHQQPWPAWDPGLATDDMVTVVVQVNGKVRDRLEVPAGTSEAALREQALASGKVAPLLKGEPRRVVVVPDRLVNIVA